MGSIVRTRPHETSTVQVSDTVADTTQGGTASTRCGVSGSGAHLRSGLRLERVARRIGLLVGALGVVVLVGWAFEVDRLKSVISRFETMKPTTAVSVVALGAALAMVPAAGRRARGAGLAAAAAASLGVASLYEYLSGQSLGIDSVLFERDVLLEANSAPGRMAPVTALCVAMAGIGLLLLLLGRRRAAHLGGMAVALTAATALAGYGYRVISLGAVDSPPHVAVHSGIALLLVGLGMVAATPHQGLVGLAQRGPGPAVLIRRALPVVVVLPLLAGWLALQAQRQGWLDREAGVAALAISCAVVGGLVLFRSAASVAEHEDERAAALAELARSNERLEEQVAARTASLSAQAAVQRASLEALEQGVVLSSLGGEVLLLNQAGAQILGFGPEELTERFRSGSWTTCREDGSVLPADERPLRRTMDTGVATSGELIVWLTKDGRPVTLRVSTQPVVGDDGKMSGVATAFADVTIERAAERAAAEHLAEVTDLAARLEQAVAIKDRFLATATHDMRGPITAIRGFADLLAADAAAASDDQAQLLAAIRRQSHRLELLVQDLLSLAVIDGGSVQMERQPIDLAAAVPQIVADACLAAEIDVDVAEHTMAVADPQRLAQIVTNLLQNALTYGAPPISITASTSEAWVDLRVADRGAGVDPAFVPHLFERFTTARTGADPAGRSTGLGLAIARGLARRLGGDVWYEPNVTAGACFVVHLPVPPGSEHRGEATADAGRRSPATT